MKVKPGALYITRGGEKVGPIIYKPNELYPFKDEAGREWCGNGMVQWNEEHSNDLIREYVEGEIVKGISETQRRKMNRLGKKN